MLLFIIKKKNTNTFTASLHIAVYKICSVSYVCFENESCSGLSLRCLKTFKKFKTDILLVTTISNVDTRTTCDKSCPWNVPTSEYECSLFQYTDVVFLVLQQCSAWIPLLATQSFCNVVLNTY